MRIAKLFPFFIVVILLFSFGCVGNNTQNQNAETKSVNTLGILQYEYSLNGKNVTSIHLLNGEQIQVGIKITNLGKHPINNVTLKLISCIDPAASNNYYNQILPQSSSYFSFTLVNNLSLASQEIKCPSTARVYFDYYTQSYHDIAVLGSSYSNQPPASHTYTDSELLSIKYELPSAFKIIDNNKIISGRIVITNIGNGFVDYPTFGKSNQLKEIDIRLPNNFTLLEVGGYPITTIGYGGGAAGGGGGTPHGPVAKSQVLTSPMLLQGEDSYVRVFVSEGDGYTTYKIISDELTPDQQSVITKLAVGSGNAGTIYLPLKIKYNGNVDPTGVDLERIYVTLYYGYSYDLFKFNLVLGSNY